MCHPKQEFVLRLFEITFENDHKDRKRIFMDEDVEHVESLQKKELNFQVNQLHELRQIEANKRTMQDLSHKMSNIGELETRKKRETERMQRLMEHLEKLRADRDRIVKSFMGEIENNVNMNCRTFLVKIQHRNKKKIDEIVLIEGGRIMARFEDSRKTISRIPSRLHRKQRKGDQGRAAKTGPNEEETERIGTRKSQIERLRQARADFAEKCGKIALAEDNTTQPEWSGRGRRAHEQEDPQKRGQAQVPAYLLLHVVFGRQMQVMWLIEEKCA